MGLGLGLGLGRGRWAPHLLAHLEDHLGHVDKLKVRGGCYVVVPAHLVQVLPALDTHGLMHGRTHSHDAVEDVGLHLVQVRVRVRARVRVRVRG